jgi:hypothetical protein
MKSLWKWCTVVVAVALFIVWGSQAQDWNIQTVASGADSAKKRVLEMDVAVGADGAVYISYINQEANAVKLVKIAGDAKQEAELARENRVAGTTVAVSNALVCVAWEELGDVHEVWSACWNTADLAAAGEPARVSAEGVIAGQANGAGWGEFSFNFDNAFAPDGTLYAVWSEDYANLKVGKYKDGAWSACGDLPDSTEIIRYPTVYVDSKGGVWVGSGDLSDKPDIFVWYSDDQCASWKARVNTSSNAGYSDGVGIVRLGDKIYQVNDDDVFKPGQAADILVNICDATADGAANCVQKVAYENGGFPHIATDGKGLYVTSLNENEVKFGYSCDAGATWTEAHIPNKYNLGFRDPDFGAALSRFRVATSAGSPNVYVAWFWRNAGKSNIMLASRPKPCQ